MLAEFAQLGEGRQNLHVDTDMYALACMPHCSLACMYHTRRRNSRHGLLWRAGWYVTLYVYTDVTTWVLTCVHMDRGYGWHAHVDFAIQPYYARAVHVCMWQNVDMYVLLDMSCSIQNWRVDVYSRLAMLTYAAHGLQCLHACTYP